MNVLYCKSERRATFYLQNKQPTIILIINTDGAYVFGMVHSLQNLTFRKENRVISFIKHEVIPLLQLLPSIIEKRLSSIPMLLLSCRSRGSKCRIIGTSRSFIYATQKQNFSNLRWAQRPMLMQSEMELSWCTKTNAYANWLANI